MAKEKGYSNLYVRLDRRRKEKQTCIDWLDRKMERLCNRLRWLRTEMEMHSQVRSVLRRWMEYSEELTNEENDKER